MSLVTKQYVNIYFLIFQKAQAGDAVFIPVPGHALEEGKGLYGNYPPQPLVDEVSPGGTEPEWEPGVCQVTGARLSPLL